MVSQSVIGRAFHSLFSFNEYFLEFLVRTNKLGCLIGCENDGSYVIRSHPRIDQSMKSLFNVLIGNMSQVFSRHGAKKATTKMMPIKKRFRSVMGWHVAEDPVE